MAFSFRHFDTKGTTSLDEPPGEGLQLWIPEKASQLNGEPYLKAIQAVQLMPGISFQLGLEFRGPPCYMYL